jgi:selenium-binding protein 1
MGACCVTVWRGWLGCLFAILISACRSRARVNHSESPLASDDKVLYVSCWGTGELLQYDVSDPFNPKKTGSVRIGGIVNRTPHPKKPNEPLAGGPQMVEVSRDGNRICFTNLLYSAWDEQFYPEGLGSWMVKLESGRGGGIAFDEKFFLESNDYRVHQIRLEEGDSSSDSFSFP